MEMGVHLGDSLNESHDCMPVSIFLERWCNRFLAGDSGHTEGFNWSEASGEARIVLAQLKCESEARSRASWGWKAPRTHLMLSFFCDLIPDLVYIHVVRHPWALATSGNQNQVEKHGQLLLGHSQESRKGKRELFDRLEFWRVANSRTMEIMGSALGRKAMVLRYEDLCASPDRTVEQLSQLTGLPPISSERSGNLIRPSERAIASSLSNLVEPEEATMAAGEFAGLLGYFSSPPFVRPWQQQLLAHGAHVAPQSTT